MVEPWTADLAALGDRAAHQLGSLATTRARFLDRASTTPRARRFALRRVLAAGALLTLIGSAAAATAYVAGSRPRLQLDFAKSERELEADIRAQLAAQHHGDTEIQVKKLNDHQVWMLVSGGNVDKLDLRFLGSGSDISPR